MKTKIPTTIKIKVTRKHAEKAGPSYYRSGSCLLGTTLKSHGFKLSDALSCHKNGTRYQCNIGSDTTAQAFYFRRQDDFDAMPRAERLRRFKPFTVTLKKVS